MTSEEAAQILGPELTAQIAATPHAPLSPAQIALLTNLCVPDGTAPPVTDTAA